MVQDVIALNHSTGAGGASIRSVRCVVAVCSRWRVYSCTSASVTVTASELLPGEWRLGTCMVPMPVQWYRPGQAIRLFNQGYRHIFH